VQFDFERRRISVLLDNGTKRMLVVKGAPEDLLALSAAYEPDEGADPLPMDAAARLAVDVQLGIPVTGVLTGSEIQQLDDPALAARVEQANLFCRVAPAQKNRIILALKRRGHVVGYLGDGINDAPSLHSADVGISVDSAVDVAKAAADMILMDQDLGVLHAGVLEGRRTFGMAGALLLAYLLAVEGMKRWFFRRFSVV
jgi:magnesium-transporting ATPase (P-type)